MFDMGFLELLLIAIVALLVLGPERLPGAIRTVTYWVSKIRRSFQQVKLELEREIDIAELKQQIHNDSILEELAKTKGDIDENIQQTREQLSKQLGQGTYQLDDAFPKQSTPKPSTSEQTTPSPTPPGDDYIPDERDSLPDHPPLPDPEEDIEQSPDPEPRPASDRS